MAKRRTTLFVRVTLGFATAARIFGCPTAINLCLIIRMTCRTVRVDGWTAERQAAFLAALADTRSTTAAARAAGMSRVSAYRLRDRPAGALFAYLWDLALMPALPPDLPAGERLHSIAQGRRLVRLLDSRYRRESGDFLNRWHRPPDRAATSTTSTS